MGMIALLVLGFVALHAHNYSQKIFYAQLRRVALMGIIINKLMIMGIIITTRRSCVYLVFLLW